MKYKIVNTQNVNRAVTSYYYFRRLADYLIFNVSSSISAEKYKEFTLLEARAVLKERKTFKNNKIYSFHIEIIS